MNEFNFGRPVKICGQTYFITTDMENLSRKMYDMATQCEQIDNLEIGNDEKLKRVTEVYKDCIDYAFGKGCFNRIFYTQTLSIYNMRKLINFITAEIETWSKELADEKKRYEEQEGKECVKKKCTKMPPAGTIMPVGTNYQKKKRRKKRKKRK